jgi:hypothetical protein
MNNSTFYKWKCGQCNRYISSETKYPPECHADPYTGEFICPTCKTGLLISVLTWEEYLVTCHPKDTSIVLSSCPTAITTQKSNIIKSSDGFDNIKNINDLWSLINEGDPRVVKSIVDGLTAESKKLFLEYLSAK